jgi:type VI secretion system secreted protein VgrG
MSVSLPDRSKALLSMTLDGDAKLLAPTSLEVTESISSPYEIIVTAMATSPDLGRDKLVHAKACVTVRRDGVPERHFAGLVREAIPLNTGLRGFFAHRLVIVPKLWGLSLAMDSRVFQQMTTQDALKKIFAEAGLDVTYSITGADPKEPYRTQFNETCLAFAHRLMEEAGWFYFFEHAAGGEKLVVADSNTAFKATVALPAAGARVISVNPVYGVATKAEKLRDYNPIKKAEEALEAKQAAKLKAGPLSLDSFVWSASTGDAEVLKKRAEFRMQAAEAAASLMAGESDFSTLTPGKLLKVAGSDNFLPAGTYVIRSVRHSATDESWLTGAGTPAYANSFECFPEKTPWREPMVTQRPHVGGVHVGHVVAVDSDGDIGPDDHARVKVAFLWDHRREVKAGEAVWARVVQPWAGDGWGAQFLPRVGTEVAVAFVNGDPDRPMVMGGLYHAKDKPIFSKAEKTKSGFRTRSTDKGGTAEFSEFSFDDKKGQELVFLHAQKNMLHTVEHDLTLKVDNCRITHVKKDETKSVDGKQSLAVKGDQTVKLDSKQDVTVKQDRTLTVTQGNLKTGVKMGNYTLKTDAGAVTIEAAQSITLKVGGSTLKITPSGIEMQAPLIKGTANGQMALSGPIVKAEASAMLVLSGALVKIN